MLKKYNLDVDKVFKEFNDSPSPPTSFKVEDTPLYKVGMFKKHINNILYKSPHFKNNTIIRFKDREEERSFIINYLHNKAFKSILDYKEDSEVWISALSYYNFNNELHKCLEHNIKYFESQEEYEKCAFLYKIFLKLNTLST